MNVSPPVRPQGVKRIVSPAEEGWINMRTLFPTPVREHSRPPVGTAPTLEGLGHFLSRIAEINAIAATQSLELPTVGQELAQTGISSFSISSSFDDNEDDASAEVSDADLERNACRYGTAYTTADLAPLVRRIEWEQFIYNCGPAQRIALEVVDGQISMVTSDKKMPDSELQAHGSRIWRAMGKPDADTLANDQARTRHYGAVGSILYGVMHGPHVPEQHESIIVREKPVLVEDPDEEGAMVTASIPEDEADGGPAEFGLHNIEQGAVLFEPTAAELWPEDYVWF